MNATLAGLDRPAAIGYAGAGGLGAARVGRAVVPTGAVVGVAAAVAVTTGDLSLALVLLCPRWPRCSGI